ncbi:hypothetical protein E1162_12475 [Rhodobacteraceae bacterium RKSG542]|uniref:transcriptional regulator GutM n=1 Tax=Pseudovibrio flavus TaxID=2529854 RepID=UPI0012BCAD9F|nr:transcriptional regulator GutM [Pseudovibrio flavus]MTI18053.1 hypothetical protein [Pseudovibrio flavus]
MELVQNALLILALLWGLQALGAIVQVRRYQAALSRTLSQWETGYLGVGIQKSLLKTGAMVILVIGDDRKILKFQAMTGRTVFSKFKVYKDLQGQTPEALLDLFSDKARFSAALHGATRQAIEKAEAAREREMSGEDMSVPQLSFGK